MTARTAPTHHSGGLKAARLRASRPTPPATDTATPAPSATPTDMATEAPAPAASVTGATPDTSPVERLAVLAEPRLARLMVAETLRSGDKTTLTARVEGLIADLLAEEADSPDTPPAPSEPERRELATYLFNRLEEMVGPVGADPLSTAPTNAAPDTDDASPAVIAAKERIQPLLMDHIDPGVAAELDRDSLSDQVSDVVGDLLAQERITLNMAEQRRLVRLLMDDMLGLGPLEPLLADESISDIMVNGPEQVYVERRGKLELTGVTFRDNRHLMNIAQRIVTAVGRRIDESSPVCDARLPDGSRVNVIAPPLAIDGASISIRKFAQDKLTIDKMVSYGSLSPTLGKLLKILGACRLNILISGGTGSGKTTMLNALSRQISSGERVVTIEDAAELQLQQPHVVRLETRPPNLEGTGEVTIRDLVKNALRMRPDRIIVGEIRGGEAIDMLQAMNTGHDGSMGTIHANSPREALTRLENMVNMAGLNLPARAIREQIASSLDVIVQVQRLRDGSRRALAVTEVVGMEGDVITTQDLFRFVYDGEDESGRLKGHFEATGVRPHAIEKAHYFGLEKALMETMTETRAVKDGHP
ncbi:CpaF family protein [Yunchengibacter salinarum]|uniref:CpaF family protein n=1 Tax=Yunchengibacter salinarum TaxID=3133399 RepID=UPI0035B5B654